MTTTPDSPRCDTPNPRASIPETRRAIVAEITRGAIARYEEVVRRDEDLARRMADDDGLGNWQNVLIRERSDAESNLIRAIAARIAPTDFAVDDAPCRRWPVCGVACGDRLYLIVPDYGHHEFVPVGEKPEEDSREWITQLAVADRSDIIDLDEPTAEDLAPPEPPAVERPAPAVPRATDEDIKAALAFHSPSVRPGRRTFAIVSGDYVHERTSRVGLTLDAVLDDELSYDVDTFEDRSVWEQDEHGFRLRAVIRTAEGRAPEVVRFDG